MFDGPTKRVDQARLDRIGSACSCGLICGKQSRIGKPFSFGDVLWICTSSSSTGAAGYLRAECYRLTAPDRFTGDPTTYDRRAHGGADEDDPAREARDDPNGFYHGITVKSGRATFILTGPPVTFVASEGQERDSQLDLFQEVSPYDVC
jgi:hypothetical protein